MDSAACNTKRKKSKGGQEDRASAGIIRKRWEKGNKKTAYQHGI